MTQPIGPTSWADEETTDEGELKPVSTSTPSMRPFAAGEREGLIQLAFGGTLSPEKSNKIMTLLGTDGHQLSDRERQELRRLTGSNLSPALKDSTPEATPAPRETTDSVPPPTSDIAKDIAEHLSKSLGALRASGNK